MTGGAHDRRRFACGVEPLDRYFREQVTQDMRRRVTHCFVAMDGQGAVAGYYTFSATGLPVTELPPEAAKRLPRYPLLPAGLVGRLAVDAGYAGQGLGSALILNAVTPAIQGAPAIFALVLDAKDDAAARLCAHLGFGTFASRPMSLYLPLGEVARRLAAGRRGEGHGRS